MTRNTAKILDDDEELDLLEFMLEACGLDPTDFFYNERVLTRENLERNYEFLNAMVKGRSFRSSSYFVIGYLILITGASLSDDLRHKILSNTKWEDEIGCWIRREDEIERQIYLNDFHEKVHRHTSGHKLHPIALKYFDGNQNLYADNKFEVIIGLDELQEISNSKDINRIHHIILQGEGLTTIPDSLYRFINLESLSLEFNQIKYIPEDFSRISSLKTLYLDYNDLTIFPEVLTRFPSLEFLSFDNNYITTLPDSIKNFISLKELYIRMNDINEIPSFLSNVKFKIEYKFFNYP